MKMNDIRSKIKDVAAKISGIAKKISFKGSSFKKFDPRKMNLTYIKANKKAFIIGTIVTLVVVLVIFKTTANIHNALFGKKPAAKEGPAVTMEEEAVPVKVFKVKRMDFKDTLPCMGNVKGFKEIDLKFQAAGVVESFNFEEGEKIQEGDIIASLIQRDALLKLKYAEIEVGKNQKLFDIGALNQMKYDQSKLEYESARSELDKTNIYAMSNGLLGSKLIDAGSYTTPNDKIGAFINIDRVYAEFNIIEKDMAKVALGQKAEVFVDAYPNKSFSGTIDRISPIVEGRSRTQNIKAEVDNREGLLKPGMFVRALVGTYEKKDAIVIPSSALRKKEADYLIYVVREEEPKEEDEKPVEKPKKFLGLFPKKEKKGGPGPEVKEEKQEFGAVEVRKISLGYMTQDLVEVAEGLKEDERIVVEIQEELKDKAKVEIAEVQEGLF